MRPILRLALVCVATYVSVACGTSTSPPPGGGNSASSSGSSGASSGSGGSLPSTDGEGGIGDSSTSASSSGSSSAADSANVGSSTGSSSGSGGNSGSGSGSGATPPTGSDAGDGSSSAPSWCVPLGGQPTATDWGKALIDSQISAAPTLGWTYPDALFLHGVYLGSRRLRNATYTAYVKAWADGQLGGAGTYPSLDSMMPALVLDDMYRETGDMKYLATPRTIATLLEGTSYPRTTDGGFWHKTNLNGQLWGDGVFMDLPQLVNYGDVAMDPKTIDVATNQLIIYDKHLAAPNNLHYHEWSEVTGSASCCEWCRAEGWYEMSLLMVLDFTPATHANYVPLVTIAKRLASGLQTTQDPATGRWWQVMDRPTDANNWLETSCTAMHAYFLSKASQKGYIDAATYGPLAIKAFQGELQMVSNPASVQIRDICPGTGVGTTPAFYYGRPKATNDNHGLGAFLIMYDQLVCR